MKKIVLIFGLLLIPNYSFSQCQKGDCKNGFSIMKYTDATFEGNYTDSKFNGLGLMYYNDKRYYQGEYKDNNFNGFGYYKWKTGEVYFGRWKNGIQTGLGIQKATNGGIQSAGIWIEGKNPNPINSTSPTNNPENCSGNCVDGVGDITTKDSERFIGVFKGGKLVFGRMIKKEYDYEGEIKDNVPNGYGHIKYSDTNEFFMGYFKDGKKHGTGIYINNKNNKTPGNWIDDEYQDPSKFEFNQKGFCKEIIALAKLTKKERQQLKIKEARKYGITLEKQFLNQFTLKSEPYADDFIGNEKVLISFPTKKDNKPTIGYDELIETCKSCKKLTPSKDSYFKYDDVEIYVAKLTSTVTIKYPKSDSCISGNCKNGNGKKKYSDAVYVGKFKDGVRNGFGKITFTNGNSHEGEYKNDKRNGKGIFIWKTGDRYEGDFVDSFRTGKGKYTWVSGDSYEGSFAKNKQEGKGTYNYASGNVYTGDYINGKQQGKGAFIYANGAKYVGDFKNNKFNGTGKEYDKDGSLFYEGNYLNSQFEGQGIYYFKSGTKYVGLFKDDKRNGFGKFHHENGKLQYEGNFENGSANGKGVAYDINGIKVYAGNYKNGKRYGQGTSYYDSGKKEYEGNWENDKKNGQGIKYYTNGKYIGEFKDNLRQGAGKLYNLEGKLTFEGQYENDKPMK